MNGLNILLYDKMIISVGFKGSETLWKSCTGSLRSLEISKSLNLKSYKIFLETCRDFYDYYNHVINSVACDES